MERALSGKLLPLECIDKENHCDGSDNCQNGSDELDCQETCIDNDQYQCIHENNKTLPLECISQAQRCDGIKNCEKGKVKLFKIMETSL